MINTLQDMEKARQQMKRQAFETYFKNTEIYNRECYVRKSDILESWSEHLGYYSNIIVHESLLMWQAAQEQVLQNRYENLANDDYMLMPTELTDEIAEAIAYSANCCGGIAQDIYQAIIQSLREVS